MRLVGLTGGIGAGKSTVSEMLASRGAVIVDADRIARELQEPGSPVVTAMVERFGDGILSEDGSLDRAAVAAIVFGSDDDSRQALADLNGIVHPAMQSEIRRRIDAERDSDRLVVLDFPLLAENPRDDLDATIVVDVDPEVAVERLVAARGMDELDARNRIANQASRERRVAIATHVVDNSGDLDALAAQVESIWNDLS
ncbi:MAG: dephospho-CoA kinase [Actinomycetota bacterium]|jgi:dephospho-CoA kinase|nr:dephospho-CoA kinase [Actinomycetota bacterium]MDA3014729.1 dephospho-CoA kinase [Actinomycetota bacterium]MDA3028124.1 dephospho-CoA kinase [Actinomycetota bacterium]